MNQQDWLNAVARDLCRRGMPKHYVRRTCCELADHAEQCESAGRRFDSMSEAPDDLCRSLVRNYRRRRLIGRLPPVVCLCVPGVLAVLVPLVYFACVGFLFEGIFEFMFGADEILPVEALMIWILFYLGVFLVPFITSALVYAVARSMERPWGWLLVMFVLLFWATVSVGTTLEMASDGPDLSLNVDVMSGSVRTFHHWGQCCIVGVIGFVMVARQRREQQLVVGV